MRSKSWDSVAARCQEWWKTFENAAQVVSDHLVELAKINPDSRVLDIATGIGEPAITAAKKIRNFDSATWLYLAPSDSSDESWKGVRVVLCNKQCTGNDIYE